MKKRAVAVRADLERDQAGVGRIRRERHLDLLPRGLGLVLEECGSLGRSRRCNQQPGEHRRHKTGGQAKRDGNHENPRGSKKRDSTTPPPAGPKPGRQAAFQLAMAASISANVRATSVVWSGIPIWRAICDAEKMPRTARLPSGRPRPPACAAGHRTWSQPLRRLEAQHIGQGLHCIEVIGRAMMSRAVAVPRGASCARVRRGSAFRRAGRWPSRCRRRAGWHRSRRAGAPRRIML